MGETVRVIEEVGERLYPARRRDDSSLAQSSAGGVLIVVVSSLNGGLNIPVLSYTCAVGLTNTIRGSVG